MDSNKKDARMKKLKQRICESLRALRSAIEIERIIIYYYTISFTLKSDTDVCLYFLTAALSYKPIGSE